MEVVRLFLLFFSSREELFESNESSARETPAKYRYGGSTAVLQKPKIVTWEGLDSTPESI